MNYRSSTPDCTNSGLQLGIVERGCWYINIILTSLTTVVTLRYIVNHFQIKFRENWELDVQNVDKNPILRTYAKIKKTFGIEKYLDLVKNFWYRNAITKIRTSSHALEKGRHRNGGVKIPACQKMCKICSVQEDEIHFVMDCVISVSERKTHFITSQPIIAPLKTWIKCPNSDIYCP